MALHELVWAVETALRSNPACVIDEGLYHTHIHDVSFTCNNAKKVAESLILANATRYATVEKFQRSDTTDTYIFVIAANTMDDWRKACRGVQAKITREIRVPSEITTRVFVRHIFDRRC